MNWELFGMAAGAITSSGFLPQIIKGYRTKKLEDLSYFMNILLGAGMVMWIVYGLHIMSISVVAANLVGVSLNIILIVMKYVYSKKNQKT